jgi:spoIIIJ-associated protein
MNNEILNTEADLAADYIEGVLDIADIDGDIELSVKNDHAIVSIQSQDAKSLDALVGENGETLLALQELARLSVNEQLQSRSTLLLDINNWREKRVQEIQKLAQEAIDKLTEQEDVHLSKMNSFERKVAHDYISENGAFSHSEGANKERHIVVTKEAVEETSSEGDE